MILIIHFSPCLTQIFSRETCGAGLVNKDGLWVIGCGMMDFPLLLKQDTCVERHLGTSGNLTLFNKIKCPLLWNSYVRHWPLLKENRHSSERHLKNFFYPFNLLCL